MPSATAIRDEPGFNPLFACKKKVIFFNLVFVMCNALNICLSNDFVGRDQEDDRFAFSVFSITSSEEQHLKFWDCKLFLCADTVLSSKKQVQ